MNENIIMFIDESHVQGNMIHVMPGQQTGEGYTIVSGRIKPLWETTAKEKTARTRRLKMAASLAVSYTHLDVYKRQGFGDVLTCYN